MGERKLTVCNGRGNYKTPPPQIVLQGQWLQRMGFFAGDKIIIDCQPGQLIIKKEELPPDTNEAK